MSPAEVKRAFLDSAPVTYAGTVYPRINAITYRRNEKGEIFLQAELLDTRSSVHCVYITAPEKLSITDGEINAKHNIGES